MQHCSHHTFYPLDTSSAECTTDSCTGNNVQCKTDGTKPVCTCTNGGKFPNGLGDVDAPSSDSCLQGKFKF